MSQTFSYNGTLSQALEIQRSWQESIDRKEKEIDQLLYRLAAVEQFIDANCVKI